MRRNHRVRRVRIYMSSFPQRVAIASDRLDQTSAPVCLELLAQMTNVHFQHVGIDLAVVPPDALQDLLPAQDLSGVAHEEQQERVLLGGQLYQMTGSVYFSSRL